MDLFGRRKAPSLKLAQKHANIFQGASTLRAKEPEKHVPLSEGDKNLQAKLAARYGKEAPIDNSSDFKKPKRKKGTKKKPKAAAPAGVIMRDEDVTGFARLKGDDEDSEGEAPVIVNLKEAELLQQQLEKKRESSKAWRSANGDAATADASPPRRQRHDTPDASPPRRQRHDTPDASPPRRQRHDTPDASPPRRQRHDSPDASPPRRARRSVSSDPEVGPSGRSARGRMADGAATGMVSSEQVAKEAQAKRDRERAVLARMDDAASGKGAGTVYRGKEGERVTAEAFVEGQSRKRKKPKVEWETAKDIEWAGGMAQQQRAAAAREALSEAAAAPFASAAPDADWEVAKQRASRWGDPMAGMLRKPTAPEPETATVTAATRKRLKKKGFVVPERPPQGHSWSDRRLPAAINRYDIKPGKWWDGVDRSNGFEVKLVQSRYNRQARDAEEQAYAVHDM